MKRKDSSGPSAKRTALTNHLEVFNTLGTIGHTRFFVHVQQNEMKQDSIGRMCAHVFNCLIHNELAMPHDHDMVVFNFFIAAKSIQPVIVHRQSHQRIVYSESELKDAHTRLWTLARPLDEGLVSVIAEIKDAEAVSFTCFKIKTPPRSAVISGDTWSYITADTAAKGKAQFARAMLYDTKI